MEQVLQRIASLEAKADNAATNIDRVEKSMTKRLDHLDECVDQVKVTIWKAAGALGATLAIFEALLRYAK